MSEVNNGVGDTSKDQVSDQSRKEDTVSYQTYKKAVGEVKKLKEALDNVMSEREEQDKNALAEQGKYKEIAEKLQKDLKLKDEESKRKEGFFVQQNLKQTVARYAKELGAKEEAIDEIFAVGSAKEYWKAIEVKEDYSINTEQVKKSLEEMSQKSPWFFVKQADPPKDIVIGGNGTKPITGNDLQKLSMDDLKSLARNIK